MFPHSPYDDIRRRRLTQGELELSPRLIHSAFPPPAIPEAERFRVSSDPKRTWRNFVSAVQAGKRFQYIDLYDADFEKGKNNRTW